MFVVCGEFAECDSLCTGEAWHGKCLFIFFSTLGMSLRVRRTRGA